MIVLSNVPTGAVVVVGITAVTPPLVTVAGTLEVTVAPGTITVEPDCSTMTTPPEVIVRIPVPLSVVLIVFTYVEAGIVMTLVLVKISVLLKVQTCWFEARYE